MCFAESNNPDFKVKISAVRGRSIQSDSLLINFGNIFCFNYYSSISLHRPDSDTAPAFTELSKTIHFNFLPH